MTLFRQLYSLLFGLFLLVVTGLALVQFTETQSFLTKQMESDLNNASHSLGLMLSPALEAGDSATVDTLVNVIFEGGYYQSIELIWLADGHQQVWKNPEKISGVPQWFIDLELFEQINTETTITSGWLQLATLKITANPGIGYLELWHILSHTFLLFALFFLLAILSARLGLTWILKPLHQLSVHAQNIANRQFGPDLPLPKTTELQQVVLAFNRMANQLKQIFQSLDDEVTALRKQILLDRVSNLPNRQYLMGLLSSWLDEPGSGALFLVKMDWLEQVHSKFGYQIRDETIRLLSSRLQENLQSVTPSVITRIAAYEFAFLIPDVERQQLEQYLQILIRTINQEIAKAEGKPNQGYAIGIAERVGDMSQSDIMPQADNALQQAIKEGKIYQWFAVSQQQFFSREQWRERLTCAFDNGEFFFRWQQVADSSQQKIIHRELFCQLQLANGQRMYASQFIPYVELLSMGSQLDKCMIQNLYDEQLLTRNPEPVAVNLTHQSISDPEFHSWLDQFLAKSDKDNKLCFEIPESAVYSSPDACDAICAIINEHGARFGIDHFGRQFGSMNYLQTLRPSYVKLDQAFAHYDENQHSSQLCRALINIARGLGIQVIITGIQEEVQLKNFSGLDIHGFQGFIKPPQDV
ncbi:MAG: EAL domain-containing protein [Shewanella sp.]|nr:EAL domain-containing protein [Shewanella sp.]